MPNGQIKSYSVRIDDLKNNSEITYTNTADGNQTNFIKSNLGTVTDIVFNCCLFLFPEDG